MLAFEAPRPEAHEWAGYEGRNQGVAKARNVRPHSQTQYGSPPVAPHKTPIGFQAPPSS